MPFQKIYFKGVAYMVDPTVAETICNMQFVAERLYDDAVSQADYQEVYCGSYPACMAFIASPLCRTTTAALWLRLW